MFFGLTRTFTETEIVAIAEGVACGLVKFKEAGDGNQ